MPNKRYILTVKFPTKDPSPPEMQEFYENLSDTLNDKWYYQEYGVAGKNKGFRRIGFLNLTPLQLKTVKKKAREYLSKVTFSKSISTERSDD
jgi:hypothetical protein